MGNLEIKSQFSRRCKSLLVYYQHGFDLRRINFSILNQINPLVNYLRKREFTSACVPCGFQYNISDPLYRNIISLSISVWPKVL